MSEQVGFVTAVHLYPIKSCHEATVDGQLPSQLEVGLTGFKHGEAADRQWVIADSKDLFVSQRGWDENHSRKHASDKQLATVRVDIQPEHLMVSAPNHGTIEIPLDTQDTRERSVKIFGPNLPAIDEGPEAAEYFSELLGREVRLTKADSNNPRMLPEKYQKPDAANQSAAADGRPFSLGSLASLDLLHDLKGWPRGRVPLNRYRTNIDIGGVDLPPFIEDRVRLWQFGSAATFYAVKSLSRCPVPNIDQKTGDDSEKLAIPLLYPSRRGWSSGEDYTEKSEPHFAQSLNHTLASIGTIVKQGDPAFALEIGESNFVAKVRD